MPHVVIDRKDGKTVKTKTVSEVPYTADIAPSLPEVEIVACKGAARVSGVKVLQFQPKAGRIMCQAAITASDEVEVVGNAVRHVHCVEFGECELPSVVAKAAKAPPLDFTQLMQDEDGEQEAKGSCAGPCEGKV